MAKGHAFQYKAAHAEDARRADVARTLERFPDRIPVVPERSAFGTPVRAAPSLWS